MTMAQGLPQLLDGVGRVGVHPAVALVAYGVGGGHDLGGSLELRHEPPEGGAGRGLAHAPPSRTSAPGTMVRISKIEITGMKRMKRKKRVKKRPRVPT